MAQSDLQNREPHRGFCGMGVYNPKYFVNLGTLYRSMKNFGCDFSFQIGQRYKAVSSDTVKHWRHIPHWFYTSWENFMESRPRESVLIAVEMSDKAHSLKNFVHPERAVYLLGAEDGGIPHEILRKADAVLRIPSLTVESINVAVAGSLVLYDRQLKRGLL